MRKHPSSGEDSAGGTAYFVSKKTHQTNGVNKAYGSAGGQASYPQKNPVSKLKGLDPEKSGGEKNKKP